MAQTALIRALLETLSTRLGAGVSPREIERLLNSWTGSEIREGLAVTLGEGWVAGSPARVGESLYGLTASGLTALDAYEQSMSNPAPTHSSIWRDIWRALVNMHRFFG
jgi:hypothetical protein